MNRVERSHHPNMIDGAISIDNGLEHDDALDPGASRAVGVDRLLLPKQDRVSDAIAGPIDLL